MSCDTARNSWQPTYSRFLCSDRSPFQCRSIAVYTHRQSSHRRGCGDSGEGLSVRGFQTQYREAKNAMYPTPGGDRVLLGAERHFFMHSLAMIVDLLADEDMEFGVAPFDELQRNQKLAVLCMAARALLQPAEPMPVLTAFVESAVATVYEHAKDQIYQEIDDSASDGTTSFWRRLALEAAREHLSADVLPRETDDDTDTWDFLVECLAGCVLWDNDYEWQDSMDLPPEESRRMRAALGMDEDYYTDVPPDPPDDQAQRYVAILWDLTAEVR